MAVQFFSADAKIPSLPKKFLNSFLDDLFQSEGKNLESLNYIFCTDEYLLALNKNYLDHNYYTDILTFDISVPGEGVTGEIYISVERVLDNAGIHKVSFKEELLRVVFHGALHLCGYKDKTPKQQAQMRRKENEYLNLFHK